MDEFDELRKRQLRDEMVERAENGFQGWTRPDGTYVDGDGRGDYRRLYGLRWKTHYEEDRAYAIAVQASAQFSSDTRFAASPNRRDVAEEDPVAQALRWAQAALAEDAGQGQEGEPPAVIEATPPQAAPSVARTGLPVSATGRRATPCPACGASNAPHRTSCLLCGKPLPANGER